ncbi:MAG: Mur ligase family protein, partial [Myxococcota bacterium]|nr:Mur ligase family protein [Myxococcota bacterium]
MILSAREIVQATGGQLVLEGPPGSVGHDSRNLRPGQWFVTLAGERFDSHDFLPELQTRGCAGAIACRVPDDWSHGFVRVENGLQALQDLGRFGRRSFGGPVVGITGSAGKTTTRAMTALVLEELGPTHQPERNLNNHFGVPLTILRAPLDAHS